MRLTGLATRIALGTTLAAAALASALAQPVAPTITITPVTDAMIQNPDPKDWLSWRRTLDSWGYSPLAQITRANVSQLRLVWVRPLEAGHQEGRGHHFGYGHWQLHWKLRHHGGATTAPAQS